MRLIPTRWLYLALLGSALLWGALVLWVPRAQQIRSFYVQGQELFSDYAMPRTCSLAADPYAAEGVCPQDRCYGMIGYVLASAFPEDVTSGGLAFTLAGAFLFALALGIFIEAQCPQGWLALPVLVLSAPFLYNLERANQIWIAAAGVLVFLAWYRSASRWRRVTALTALALACAFKITPGVFSLLLLKDRRWRDFAVFAVLGALLTLVPFACHGGLSLVPEWLARMHDHTACYSRGKTWGTATLFWAPLRILGRFVPQVPSVGGFGQLVDSAIGGLSLYAFFKTHDRRQEFFLLAAVVVLLPSVSQYYTLLYFVPALVLAADERLPVCEVVLWFVLMTPLYPFVWKYSLNPSVVDWALMALVLLVCHAALVRRPKPEDRSA